MVEAVSCKINNEIRYKIWFDNQSMNMSIYLETIQISKNMTDIQRAHEKKTMYNKLTS